MIEITPDPTTVFVAEPLSVRRLRAIRDILALVIAVLVAIILIVVLVTRHSSDRSTAHNTRVLLDQVAELRHQVDDARALAAAARSEDQLADDCVDYANAAYLTAVGDLLAVVSSTPPGSPERETQAAPAAAVVQQARDYLRSVVKGPRPSDCPPVHP